MKKRKDGNGLWYWIVLTICVLVIAGTGAVIAIRSNPLRPYQKEAIAHLCKTGAIPHQWGEELVEVGEWRVDDGPEASDMVIFDQYGRPAGWWPTAGSDITGHVCERCGEVKKLYVSYDAAVELEKAYRSVQKKQRCPVVLTEIVTSGEAPDGLGFYAGTTYLVECKASRSDFLNDAKKPYRRESYRGLGNHRYYLCPDGLIAESELPEKWGLLYATEKGVRYVRTADYQVANREAEQRILLSVLRRIAPTDMRNINIKVYTMQGAGEPKATATIEHETTEHSEGE